MEFKESQYSKLVKDLQVIELSIVRPSLPKDQAVLQDCIVKHVLCWNIELWKDRELVQLYQDQAHFQVQYGAPVNQKVWQATSRADQGLMMLIDRNMDRLAKRYNCKKISTKLQGQRRVSVFYGCQLPASFGTNRRISNPTGTDDISHFIFWNFMITSNPQPRAFIQTTLM